MIQNEQIAHDLAISLLHGSKLSVEDVIKQYRQYYNDLLASLNNEPKLKKEAKVIRSPI